ncbi:hypothetical protein IRY55_08260 [Savagea sp. SN6]|uniref:Uncharacterized protein n=1 Tax=Savagea serpentis TaxID=2785297 RepID=A0A8J7KCE0_9BACL|nr:hypothetical protein [Savagea serpentis]MBF4501352.1 hypothetical protein [Savagea serpentis]
MKDSKYYTPSFHADILAFLPGERQRSFVLQGDNYYAAWHNPFYQLKYSLENYGLNYDLLVRQRIEHLNKFPEMLIYQNEKLYKVPITFTVDEETYIFTPTEGQRNEQSIWYRADRLFGIFNYYYSASSNMSSLEMRQPNLKKQEKIMKEKREKEYSVGSLIVFDNGMKIAAPVAKETLSYRNELGRLYLANQDERILFS